MTLRHLNRARPPARPASFDVIGHPSPAGLTARREQIERDRLRLLEQLEAEQLNTTTPPPGSRAR